MELEFDKEIDALLRKAGTASPAAAGMPGGSHLDADELAAFAENALPDRTRQMYFAHLADCDMCRKTLSGFISMNPEAAPDAAFAAAAAPVAAVSAPWWSRFLSGPNLAYTMGTLVVLFSGMIGLLVWQNGGRGGNADVSQVRQTAANSNATSVEAPNFQDSNASSTVANTAANTNSSSPIDSLTKTGVAVGESSPPTGADADDPRAAGKNDEVAKTAAEPNVTTDGVSVAGAQPIVTADTARPKDQPGAKPERREQDEKEKALAKTEDKVDKLAVDNEARNRMDAQVQNQAQNQINSRDLDPGSRSAKRAETSKQAPNISGRQIQDLPVGGRSLATSIRNAGGKKFEFRDGIWYDTAYTGQGKKDYKRGTEKYLRLDAGLRSIADEIGGTVVVVWNGAAYKIK